LTGKIDVSDSRYLTSIWSLRLFIMYGTSYIPFVKQEVKNLKYK
jgi:hypothetical protein